jgi:glutamate N-acetyltransferase/amino-acid N-acetyltransferase
MTFAPGTVAAGVFTNSLTPSAPVDWCRAQLPMHQARALLVNSGNANAFTGQRGVATVTQSVAAVAQAMDCSAKEVFVASTGVIGEPLPAEKIIAVMPALKAGLVGDSWTEAARAIMTTDTFPKASTREIVLVDGVVRLNGIAKGSGMIAPDMATMLSFIATDAPIAAPVLQQMLQQSCNRSFNCLTVDGDTSTSDSLMLFATGKAPVAAISSMHDPRAAVFQAALDSLMIELAQLVAKDGEGAQKFITVEVTGAKSDAAARRIALSIANSPLVKTAIAGEDANWGRIVMAVGKSGEEVDRDRLAVAIGGVLIAKDGERVGAYDEAPVAAHMQSREIHLAADIGLGNGRATVWTCDLTHGYISINADYRS